MNGQYVLLGEWLIAVSVSTWGEIRQGQLPEPRRYVGSGIIYGMLYLAAPLISDEVAAMLGFAVMVAILAKAVTNPPGRLGSTGKFVKPANYRGDALGNGATGPQLRVVPA